MTLSDVSDGGVDLGQQPSTSALYTPGWVARRLGVTAATLRSWHHRYDLGPTGRTSGGHRRYSSVDLDRLDQMCRLTASGVAVGEAARLAHDDDTSQGAAGSEGASGSSDQGRHTHTDQVQLLTAAADAVNQTTVRRIVADAVHTDGVITAWNTVLAPALRWMGERYGRTAEGVHAEHVLSECVQAALFTVAGRDRRWNHTPPVLLAAPDGEHHVLALHALAAALAELGQRSVLLGASAPPPALAAATAQINPAVIFLWSHSSATAQRADLPAPSTRQHHTPPIVVLGGPGWHTLRPPQAAIRTGNLVEAVHACITRSDVGHPGP